MISIFNWNTSLVDTGMLRVLFLLERGAVNLIVAHCRLSFLTPNVVEASS
jgi:hypothetical protein